MKKSNKEVAAIILAGGQGERLSVLTEKRALASVPFAGKYRIIDFPLSNCVNSGLYNIQVLTQYRTLSLHDHIGNGKPWDLDRLHGGVRLVSPYLGRKDAGWDRGTADAVYQNIEELTEEEADSILILAGDHIYKMDYRPMINFHFEKEADVTVGVVRIPIEEASRFGIVSVDESGKVTDFTEKPSNPASNLVSMGIYIFDKSVLLDRVSRDAGVEESRHDFGRNIIPQMIASGDKVFAYTFNGYWADVGTIEAFWNANIGLLQDPPALDLYERNWVIYTRSQERPPATISSEARLESSMISHGCQISGQVIRSVLSPGVIVEEGALVQDSIIMNDTVIGKNAVIDRAVIDKEVRIGAGSQVGVGDDTKPNRREPDRLTSGITVIGKRAVLPEGIKIGRNCKVGTDVKGDQFKSGDLLSGESIDAE